MAIDELCSVTWERLGAVTTDGFMVIVKPNRQRGWVARLRGETEHQVALVHPHDRETVKMGPRRKGRTGV